MQTAALGVNDEVLSVHSSSSRSIASTLKGKRGQKAATKQVSKACGGGMAPKTPRLLKHSTSETSLASSAVSQTERVTPERRAEKQAAGNSIHRKNRALREFNKGASVSMDDVDSNSMPLLSPSSLSATFMPGSSTQLLGVRPTTNASNLIITSTTSHSIKKSHGSALANRHVNEELMVGSTIALPQD
jgi:hypothetical protein